MAIDVESLSSTTAIDPRPSVDWSAILAGAAIATATGLILLTFGAALGLSVTSPYEGEGLEPIAFAIGAGLFFLWVQIMSFYMGGYVSARLRARAIGQSEYEVDVRDGLHGLITWSVGVVAAGIIAFAGIGGIGVSAKTSPDQVSASVARVVDQQIDESAVREEAKVAPADSTTAERRAEIARKLSVISAFVTAASLLIGAVAAFYGAHSGGNHRDRNVAWVFFTSAARPRQQIQGD
jgi:hypothetical protein